MTIEAATYVSQFDITLPADPDPIGEGNGHIRLIKAALKATFPNVTAPITVTQDDLATVPGTRDRVTALEASVLTKTGNQSLNGNLGVSGVIIGGDIRQAGYTLVPRGVIVMWAGALNTVPAGWLLCDGTLGTPDLRDRFIIGAGLSFPPYAVGGAPINGATTTTSGSHVHATFLGQAGGHHHDVSTYDAGAHSHGGATGGHALTIAELPSHAHTVYECQYHTGPDTGRATAQNSGYTTTDLSNSTSFVGSDNAHTHPISADGTHSHSGITTSVGDHTHEFDIDTAGSHSHYVEMVTMPPYLALGFIMKS
jgi:hypothetical protein